jgi:hypothetical protein
LFFRIEAKYKNMNDRTNNVTKINEQSTWRTVLNLTLFSLLAAILIFLAAGTPSDRNEVSKVVFSTADLAQVSATYERTWSRKPTYDELSKAFESYVRSEILYREALARGLDRNDPVVKMSLVRKILLLGAAQAQISQPTDSEIEAYFDLRKEQYRLPGNLSLEQVFLSSSSDPDDVKDDVDYYLKELNENNASPEDLAGIRFSSLLPDTLTNISESELKNIFGEVFRIAVINLPEGPWVGPVESSYGLHLVRILSRNDSSIPSLQEVRERVITDMVYEGRSAAEEQFYAEVLPRYEIVFESEVTEVLEGGNSSAQSPSTSDE